MAVSQVYEPLVYNGNGSSKSFPVTWEFFAQPDLIVTLIAADGVQTVQTISSHYDVTGGAVNGALPIPTPGNGTVEMLIAPASGTKLRIERLTSPVQSTTFASNDAFPPKAVEGAYDRRAIVEQELRVNLRRGIKQTPQEYAQNGEIFLPEAAAGQLFGWNAAGDALENKGIPADIDLAVVTPFIEGLLDDETAAEAHTTLFGVGASGYAWMSDGAASAWTGFLPAGTNAVTRTWRDKAREIISVKDFGATGDGTTTDTTSLQAAINAAHAAGNALYVPSGRYITGGLTLPTTGDLTIFGDGRSSVLVAAADTTAFFTLSDAYAFTHKTFYGLAFDGNGGTNCRGIACNRTRETKVLNCHFEDLKYNVVVDRCRGFWLSDITCRNSGAFFFHSTADTDYCQQVLATNVSDPVGTDINTTYGVNAWWYLKDVVNGCLVNCTMAGMAGNSRCFSISGKTEGVFLHNCVVGWPSVGLFMEGVAYVTQGATIYPQYCSAVSCGFDQPSVSAAVIVGDYHYITGCWLPNGSIRSNTDAGVTVKANSISVKFKDCYIAYHERDGIKIESGATGVLIDGCDFTNNNGSGGSYYDIDAPSAARGDVRVVNCSPGLTANIGGQTVVNGRTSPMLTTSLVAASTTAVTTAEDLISYTVPANTLRIGQRVRIKAWGSTAANANTKTGRLFFGSANLGGWSAALNAVGWSITAEVFITGSATQEYVRESLTSSMQVTRGDTTQSLSSTIAVKFQGQNGTASAGDITCEGLTVEILD